MDAFPTELDAEGVLAASVSTVRERRAAQVKDWLLVLQWADLHGDDPQARPGAIPVRYGGDRLVDVGGDGTPRVADLCVHELAIARGTHPASTRSTMADVLDLRHRLPLVWAIVCDLGCEAWVAAKVARASRSLDRHQVAMVDAAVAAAIGGMAPGRVIALAEAKVIEADTAAHAARIAERARRRGVWAGGTETDPETGVGSRTMVARLEPGDVTWVDAVLERIVDAFLARPDVLVEHHPELFAGATTAISEVGGYSIELDGNRAYLIQTGEKALDWIRLRARGTAAHGSRVWHDNAVTRLAEAVAALGRHEWPVVLCDTTREMVAAIAKIVGEDPATVDPERLLVRAGSGAGFILASLRNTSNPTVLAAGYKHNVIPDTAEALIDVRSLPADQPGILDQVQRIVGDDIEIEVVHSDIGLEVPFSGEAVAAMSASLRREDPEAEVLPYLLSGGTDNKALARLGITGYGFVPLRLPADLDFPGMFHGVDERVPLDALDFGHRVLVDLLRTY